jgi:hypothetical protein
MGGSVGLKHSGELGGIGVLLSSEVYPTLFQLNKGQTLIVCHWLKLPSWVGN